ncbi:MAG: NAD(+) diphosphatase [Spirochaetaceae bacterium]|nr:NAD(+) diphosphatase [Spirochaetaceae bacterium]
MPEESREDRLYIFQGPNLIVPEDFPDGQIAAGVSRGRAEASFGVFAPGRPSGAACFDVPAADGGLPVSGVLLAGGTGLPPGWRSLGIRQGISLLPDEGEGEDGAPARLFRAYHIMQWRVDSVFCGACGSRNGDAPTELARLCPACGRQEFPRISPAVIVLITNDRDEVLLAHNRKFSPGVYSLIAGFTEAGESAEATVAREVREEVALEVRDIRYEMSQPWPFPNSLMLGFTARHAGGTVHPDGIEIEDARWFRRDQLPLLPGKGSVSRRLINRWIAAADIPHGASGGCIPVPSICQ